MEDPLDFIDDFGPDPTGGRREMINLGLALRMIREAVEDCAPPGAVANDETLTPEPWLQAEPLVRGIYAIANGKPMSESPPQDLRGPTADDLRAKVFRDREHSGDWRVEKSDEDGGVEVALFSGGDARQRALSYADGQYGEFDEITLHPYHRAPPLGQVLDDLSRSGISVTIDAIPGDEGYIFRLGDTEKNTEGSGDSIFDLVLALMGSALRTFPTSKFAEQYRGKTF